MRIYVVRVYVLQHAMFKFDYKKILANMAD